MNIQKNISLAGYTSFGVGGAAEQFVEIDNTQSFIELLKEEQPEAVWLLGYGSNTLVSDKGLPGLTVVVRGGTITVNDEYIVADAGVWWDDIVQSSIEHNLWGIELMSEIPGSMGAATFINITAYGQAIGPVVEWVEVWDTGKMAVVRLDRGQLQWDYKKSLFQNPENKDLIILRTCLKLSHQKTTELTYQKALDVAEEQNLDSTTLQGRRDIIIEARTRAGSIWKPTDGQQAKTAGSFFRNPTVDPETAEQIMGYEEFGKSKEQIKNMNSVHGGNSSRVSAAHVMLAAGFTRGQSWGSVKLNEQNLLKIEALDGAAAQDVYDVALEIQTKCEQALGIKLEPEARILGDFSK